MKLNASIVVFLSSFWVQILLISTSAYTPQPARKMGSFGLGYRSPRQTDGERTAPVTLPVDLSSDALVDVEEATRVALLNQEQLLSPKSRDSTSTQNLHNLPPPDPSHIKFAPSKVFRELLQSQIRALPPVQHMEQTYPFALMLQASAPYIASHAGHVAVFHIPGECVVSKQQDDSSTKSASSLLFSDIALAHLLGMKIVIVVGNRFSVDECDFDLEDLNHSHECHNSLKVTDEAAMRHVEEEAGYLRVEVERKLNRYLRLNGVVASTESTYVVSGNFYQARKYGKLEGQDFEHTGFTKGVNVASIQHHIDNDDIVLLTTVGVTPLGQLVNVNSYHLTASVAAALQAYKVIYFSNQGTVLTNEDLLVQDIPLSFARALADYHQVSVHNTGFATFQGSRQTLDAGAVELLLQLSWASWALERGVKRAHVVNPGDGAILEELFTSTNGANTCLYHDSELQGEEEEEGFENDWDSLLIASDAQQVKKTQQF